MHNPIKQTIPLQWRVPNPPPTFVGQQRSSQALSAHRDPVTIISGHAGMGKTALMCQWLHQTLKEQLNTRGVWISLHTAHNQDALYGAIAQALRQIEGQATVTHYAHAQDLTYAIDTADERELYIVLDNAHHVDDDVITQLTQQIQQYARKARWFILSRRSYPQCIRQQLPLQHLDPAHLLKVLEGWMDDQSMSTTMAEPLLESYMDKHAPGNAYSLWELERCFWGMGSQEPEQTEFGDDASTLLDFLSTTWRPIPAQFIQEHLKVDAQTLALLTQQHIIKTTHLGVLLTEQYRAIHDIKHATGQEDQHDTIKAMASSSHHGLRLEAIRLAIVHQHYDLVDTLLDQHFEDLRRTGHLTDIYGYLCAQDDPRLSTWQFRCACYMSRFERATELKADVSQDIENTNYWLYLLLMQGRLDELIDIARPFLESDHTAHDPQLVDQMRLVTARALIQKGELQEALSTIDGVVGRDVWMQLRVDFVRFSALNHLGQFDECNTLLLDIRTQFEALTHRDQRHWCNFMVFAYYRATQYKNAAEIIERFFESPSPNIIQNREWILFAVVWSSVGELDKAERAIKHAMHHYEQAPASLAMTINVALVVHLTKGNWSQVEQLVRQFADLPQAQLTAMSRIDHDIILHQLQWMLGEASWINEVPAIDEHGTLNEMYQSTRDLTSFRHGRLSTYTPKQLDAENTETKLYLGHLNCLARMIDGEDQHGALHQLIQHASKHHAVCLELELRGAALINAWLHRPSELPLACQHLQTLARRHNATRFDVMATFFQHLHDRVPVHTLDLWLCITQSQPHSCALSTRLCAAMLGEPHTLDRLEALIVDTFHERFAMQPTTIGTLHTPTAVRWGIEPSTGEIWSINDHTLQTTQIDPKSTPFQLLRQLANTPQVDKEHLILQTWPDITTYHPLQHDNRLRLAIKRLRKTLSDNLGPHEWITTTEDGYGVGIPLRWLESQ